MPSLRSNRVVTPDGVRPATIRHDKGKIVEIGNGPADDDFGDLAVLPGLVDSHVHINEPGRTDWEGFATATRAAAAGGATTIVDMPLNSIPPTVTVESLRAKRASTVGQLHVDVAFWGGIIPGSEGEIAALTAAGVPGFKVFLADSGVPEFPPVDDDLLVHALAVLADLDRPALIHAESPALLASIQGDPRAYANYLASRPPEAEVGAVRRCAELASSTGARVHILHVAAADAAAVVGSGPSSLTGETCPHYLTFAAEDIPAGATQFKCAPPIRARDQREALWEALTTTALSMVVSDHSPAPPEIKALDTGDFSVAWGGIASLQVRLHAVWTGASVRGHGLGALAEWLADAPARLAGLDTKGSLELGKDADFVVFDPDGTLEVKARKLEHRHAITPYEGMTLRGDVAMTVLRGTTVFEKNRGVTGPSGRMLPSDD